MMTDFEHCESSWWKKLSMQSEKGRSRTFEEPDQSYSDAMSAISSASG